MGGRGSGGLRVGSGRKSKGATILALHGGRDRKPSTAPAAVVAPLEPVAMPADLPDDQRAVWLVLAPHALAARTLTAGTAESFRDLCRAIVVRDGLLATIQAQGWTFVKVSVDGAGVEHQELKKHPLVADHRGWEQRVEAGRARFRIAPIGKEIAAPVKAADPFEEFDTPKGAVQ